MDLFTCPRCGQLVFFANTQCLRCGSSLAFDPAVLDMVLAEGARRCANQWIAACNWLARPGAALCPSCALTRTRPADDDHEGLAHFAVAEGAKRRLVYELLWLGLPIEPRDEDGGTGVAFDLLASTHQPVTTGHAGGVITLDLAESDDAHREAVRTKLREPYRTVLGHFRHEIGHYYFPVLVGEEDLPVARALFGDETADYAEALERHYRDGPPPGWPEEHVSEYATMHPSEDWAETFAHYLHIRTTLGTAAAYGLRVDGGAGDAPGALRSDPSALEATSIEALVETWLPLSYALNAVSRSMGEGDLYPFVLTARVLAKLGFVHQLVGRAVTG